jgi:hypothetical protein
MGTSQSSGGPGSGIPMIPSWVPEVPDENPADKTDPGSAPAAAPARPTPATPTPLAPAGRFSGARRNLGSFAKGGEKQDLKRGLGHYVRSGYGGSATTSRRLGGTVAGGKALYDALSSLAGGAAAPAKPTLDRTILEGRTARQVMDAIVEAVQPVNGTLDAEASRASVREALSELLGKHPEADLLNLTEEQRHLAVETFVARDVFHRVDLDIGRTIREKAPSAATALSRLKEMREFVKQEVSAAFRGLRAGGRTITRQTISRIITAALRETFRVFESYLE